MGGGKMAVRLLLAVSILMVGCVEESVDTQSDISHELPIVTHWSNASGSFEYLAFDQIETSVPYPSGDYAPGACYPRYDHYVGMNFSTTAIPDGVVEEFAQGVFDDTGVPLKFLRPDALESGRLVSEPGYVQVVHGLIVQADSDDTGSLATVFLPPNWWTDAPAGSYPIVANGMYDLNYQVFHRVAHAMGGTVLARFIANSGTHNRSGAIGVLWNGGGAEATFTLNEKSFRQFGSLIDLVAERFRGDRNRVLMTGNSRGGSTAVSMASNPLDLDYTVTFATVSSALPFWGTGPTLASATYAKQLNNLARVTGHSDAWRTGWRFPDCGGPEHLVGLGPREASAEILMGLSDPAEVDATWSPASPRFVDRLEEEGTQLYLEIAGHDTIPFVKQAEYARVMQAAGIPLHVDVLVRGGHTPRYVNGEPTITSKIWEALLTYIDPGSEGAPSVAPGFDFYRVDRTRRELERFEPSDGMFPFTMDAPFMAARGQRFPIVMVGEPGTRFDMRVLPDPDAAEPVLSMTGEIPTGSATTVSKIQWFEWPADAPVGTYYYALRIRKPGKQEWQEIESTNTPAGPDEPAVLKILEDEPNLSGAQLAARYREMTPSLEGFRTTIWGLSEY
jgi:hypothetical protein